MGKDIIVIAEILGNTIQPITYEIIACAENISKQIKASISVFIIHHEPDSLAKKLSQQTNHNIVSIKTPNSVHYNSYMYKKIIADTINSLTPCFICIGHTSQGIDFAPGLAVKLDCACITSVNGLSTGTNGLIFSSPVFGGKLNANIEPATEITILTIQPGVFIKKHTFRDTGSITSKTVSEKPKLIESTGVTKPDTAQSDLNEAKTVIAFGRGIQEPEHISLIKKFSLLFSGSAIACSRPIVDMGWMKYKYQVGITGAVISPVVYIACGISGSSQHIAGMNRSEFVIAINNDPNAAIFNVADICIIEDMFSFFETFEQIFKF